MTTLRDVARAAGVSTASASRVLGGGATVSPGLQLRIRAAATRLGYVPNLAARTLATRRSGLIGVVVDTMAEALTAEIVMACESKLAASGYGIVLGFATDNAASPATEALLGRGVEAIVFANIVVPSEVSGMTAAHRLPCVQLGGAAVVKDMLGISIGRSEGAALAARYLQSLGHGALGVLASSDGDVAVAVRQAVSGASVTLETSATGPDLDAARSIMRRWLGRDDPPTAIICGSDSLALAALRECRSLGIRVPQDLSLIGFGDALFARLTYPALSTIRVAGTDLGIRVAEAVLASLHGRELPSLATAAKLIARESTAPPPAGIKSLPDVSRET